MKRVIALLVVVVGCKGASKQADPITPAEPAQPAQPAKPAKPTTPKPAIVPIVNGDVDASEREGGSLGLKIPKLTAYVATLAKLSKGDTLLVALDRATPARLLTEVVFSAKQKEAGYKRFQILAQVDDKLVGAPLLLPDRAPAAVAAPGERKPGDCITPIIVEGSAGAPPPDPANTPVKPVVMITKDTITLWSISGLEGTLKAPKAAFPIDDKAPAAITAALAEIVKNRWSGTPRPECGSEIIVMPDSTIPMSVVVPILGAVRATADGTVLFPDVLLSLGLE